jgi:hypothetical protein
VLIGTERLLLRVLAMDDFDEFVAPQGDPVIVHSVKRW